jgi:hypothetical protein
MKTKLLLSMLALGASAWLLTAQDTNDTNPPRRGQPPAPRHGGPGREGHRPPPPPPVMLVLDPNDDGVIDAAEIANASAALLNLDADGNGALTRDELLPPPPPEGAGAQHRPHHGPPPGEAGN